LTAFVTICFVAVYLGMLLGGVPGLRIDRTGVALLGVIVLFVAGGLGERHAIDAIDVPTLAVLFGLMVVSAQLHLGGFYGAATQSIVALPLRPPALLAGVVVLAGAFSAVLTNDVVCLAIAPPLMQLCRQRRLDPIPYLLALACAANVGSAATLIGNPQNILIGEVLDIPFNRYLAVALPPVVIGLFVVWGCIAWQYRGRWQHDTEPVVREEPTLNRWQSGKGLLVVVGLVTLFVVTDWPRELVALAAAGLLLLNRTFHSREMMGLVDWQLILLFICLFIVNDAFREVGGVAWIVAQVEAAGFDPSRAGELYVGAAVLGNLVSNVPAVMLLLPLAHGPEMGAVLALGSTLAGNLIIVGSIANIIVVETARRGGVEIDVRTHARVGVPVTLATLAIAWGWLAFTLQGS
jgi:Na+/H+ antiporter NhaD/arsenite permease-like protein